MKALPLITLLLLTTILPELITGSTSLAGFFNPGLFNNILQALGLILFQMHNPSRAILTAAVDGLFVCLLLRGIRRTPQPHPLNPGAA